MIRTERVGATAIVRVEGPKANAMNTALLDALDAAFAELAASDARAVVVTGKGRAFSAGLALPELIALDRDAMRTFIGRFEQVMLRVLECPVPVVAAINGFAIAGGCVLALMCDARVMAAGEATIGLNEVQIGIGLPASVVEGARLRLSPAAQIAVMLGGSLFAPERALELGLVDEVAAPEELERRAIARAELLSAGSAVAHAQVKAAIVRPVRETIVRVEIGERDRWLDTWFSDEGQALLRETVARLVKR